MTDININVELSIDEALLGKLKQQRSESREKVRPFVPETIADSTVLPGRETRAGSNDFSTDAYTSSKSLSRQQGVIKTTSAATDSFSRNTFTQAYNQSQTTTAREEVRGRYYDPDWDSWRDEPNRLIVPNRSVIAYVISIFNHNAARDDNFRLYMRELGELGEILFETELPGIADLSYDNELTLYAYYSEALDFDFVTEINKTHVNLFSQYKYVLRGAYPQSYQLPDYSDALQTQLYMKNIQRNNNGNFGFAIFSAGMIGAPIDEWSAPYVGVYNPDNGEDCVITVDWPPLSG